MLVFQILFIVEGEGGGGRGKQSFLDIGSVRVTIYKIYLHCLQLTICTWKSDKDEGAACYILVELYVCHLQDNLYKREVIIF